MAIFNYDPPKAKEAKPPEKGTGMINYCRTEGMMSECGVTGQKWCDHKDCKFARKSDYSDRCMHLTFDEYCDNWEAQKSANDLKGSHYNLTS